MVVAEVLALGAAGAGIYLSTNLDNLIVYAAALGAGTLPRRQARRVVYAVAAVAVLFAAIVARFLTATDEVGVPEANLRWLGLVPLALGLWTLSRLRPGTATPATSAGAAAVLFLALLANSGDSLAALLPLMVETEVHLRPALVAGVAAGALLLPQLAALLLRHRRVARALERHGPRLGAAVMLLVGLYILANSPTDQG